jgi:hypothetical protein
MAHTGALAYPTGDDAIGVGPHRGAELPSNLNAVLEASPEVVLADLTPTIQELQRLTRAIPIVFVNIGDPVETGVARASRGPAATRPGS